MSESAGGGLRLDGAPRTGACGRWYSATTGDGRRRGAMLIDPTLLAADGALDRAVAAVTAVRRLKLPGVLRMADLLDHGGRTWLITEAPAAPTVAEVLTTGATLDPTSAALLVSDTGQTLHHLHQAGVAHGAVGPDTVVVTGAGAGSLIEVGLAAALRDATADRGADVIAWAALVRTLAQACPPAADLLTAVAAAAEANGLAAGVGTLTAGAQALPGFPQRDGLVAIARAAAIPVPVPASASASPAQPGAPTPLAPVQPAVPPAPGEGSRTLLPAEHAAVDPADEATRMGKRAGQRVRPASAAGVSSGAASGEVHLRFGSGVPASAAQVWQGTTTRPDQRRRGGRRRRTLRAVLSGLITLALVGGVLGFLWWRQRNPLVVTAAAVAPAQAPGNACDLTVDVVGNGADQWQGRHVHVPVGAQRRTDLGRTGPERRVGCGLDPGAPLLELQRAGLPGCDSDAEDPGADAPGGDRRVHLHLPVTGGDRRTLHARPTYQHPTCPNGYRPGIEVRPDG